MASGIGDSLPNLFSRLNNDVNCLFGFIYDPLCTANDGLLYILLHDHQNQLQSQNNIDLEKITYVDGTFRPFDRIPPPFLDASLGRTI